MSEAFARWARVDAVKAIGAARSEEELEAVVARCRELAGDPGQQEVAAAIRRRRVELAIAGGEEAVAMRHHLLAVADAKRRELWRVLEVLAAFAAELDGEARLARGHGRQLEAAAKAEHARLIRRAARRIEGR